MDGIPGGTTAGGRHQDAAAGSVRPLTAVLLMLGIALLSGAFSVLVMLPAAQHLRSFQDGEQTSATLHTEGSCMIGQCKVEFRAGGRTVVADLPVGSGGGKSSVGARMTVRYHVNDPRVAVRDGDVGGGGAAVLAVISGGTAPLFLVMSVVAPVYALRQRRADPVAGVTSPESGPAGPANP
ncbi:hypothetical protein DMH02_006480 [Streptomyces sp. WAC 00631]|uniref:hypothetical protein n=1 Tax=Streptomyces sp. WAC 00631 TaxID=2203201 RepID=UPI001E50B351|nr:hypothetical protein [Streptomyces sp. WAC 00631]MCC5032889.1 hypothetical protein [Streptomyces sp. WAC 00631]